MSDETIISSMVKGREYCRKLVQTYERVRQESSPGKPGKAPTLSVLTAADRTVTRMLIHLNDLPDDPQARMHSPEDKRYASRLLRETRDLLERAMILERELRDSMPADVPQGQTGAAHAPPRLRGYSRAHSYGV